MAEQATILFVCLGNICRSPMAEGAFRDQARRAGLAVHSNSAGTGNWHRGAPPDARAQAVAVMNGVDISDLRARQVTREDFERFDNIVAMDSANLHELQRLQPPQSRARLSMMLDHAPGRAGESVADPYHGDLEDFSQTWADVSAGAAGLIAQMTQKG